MDETVLSFGRWRLLPRSRRLMAGEVPVPLGSRAFDLLLALVEAGGALVTKDELLRRVWPGTVVEENNLQVQASALRKALGDDAALIQTVPGRGYRFGGVARAASDPAPAASGGPRDAPQAPPSARPVLVVLPFANMSGDPEQEYFADGITEEMTTALSHLRWFAVIARNSAFTYKGRAVDVRQVGRELGVGYALEGSVRKAGGRVRISAQLCEAETGRHVWAGRFDGDLTDVFELQDRVTEAVVGAIEPSLKLAEAERVRVRATESLGAYDLYLRALPQRWVTRAGNDAALRLLRRAVTLDPGFAAAKGALADLHTVRFTQGWAEAGDVEEAVRAAREVVAGADGGGGDDPSALSAAAHALAYLGKDHDAALAAADRALRLAPNSAMVLLDSGWLRAYAGDAPTAIAHLERAMRLSPVDPAMSYLCTALSLAHFVGGGYGQAAAWARRAVHDRPTYLPAHRLLATSLAQLGDADAARAAVRALLARAAPGYTVAAAAAHTGLRDPVLRGRYLDGLRRAGLPEG
jgi:TolB-like protein/Flp pilus assembly protein TadD